jgi:hypothetical protein
MNYRAGVQKRESRRMPFDLPPPLPAFDFTLATQGMSKGISQTDGPQVIPRLSLKSGGFQAGGLWKNITSTQGAGEAQLFVGWSGKAAGFDVGAQAAHRMVTGITDRTADNSSWEFTGTAGRKLDKAFGFKATAIYSPDDLGAAKRSLYIEGGPTLALPHGFIASAAIGRRNRVGAPDYTSYNAGVSKTIAKRMTFDLRYYDNSRHDLGGVYSRRVVGSVKVAF